MKMIMIRFFILFTTIILNSYAVVLPYDYRALRSSSNPTPAIHTWVVVMNRNVEMTLPSPSPINRDALSVDPPPILPPSLPPSTGLPSSPSAVNPTPLASATAHPTVFTFEVEAAFPSPGALALRIEHDDVPSPTHTPKATGFPTPEPFLMPSTKPARTPAPTNKPIERPFSSDSPLPPLPAGSPVSSPTITPPLEPSPISSVPAKATRTPMLPTKERPAVPFASDSPLPLLPTRSSVPSSTERSPSTSAVNASDALNDEEIEELAASDHPTMTLIASKTGRIGTTVHDGFNICPHNLAFRGISVACEYPGAKIATFLVDGKVVSTARVRPFTISGLDDDGLVAPWEDYPDGSTVRLTCVIDDMHEYSATGRFTCE